MKNRILKAERRPDNLTRLTWEDDSGKKGFEDYLFTCGAVVWPHGILPGIILMAGQEQSSERVTVFEEKEFRVLIEAVDILDDLWDRYLPIYYFYGDVDESRSFIIDLRKRERMSEEKLPFGLDPYGKNEDFENQMIKDFLSRDSLKVPAGGILAGQLQADWADSKSENESFYGIKALRYLLGGSRTCSINLVKKEPRRPPKDGSEVAWLELKAIKKELEETEDSSNDW